MKVLISWISALCLSLSFAADQSKNVILALGDSLTEGYGVEEQFSYPAQLEAKLKELGKPYKVINGGISGSTSASGKSRLKWFFKAKPKIIILALGANDGLRGLKIQQTKDNLETIIQMAKEKKIVVIMAGMQMPPNYGKEYRATFKKMFFDLAKKYELPMIPFLLKDIAGVKELNIEDGIHPNKDGYKIMVETVYATLKEFI